MNRWRCTYMSPDHVETVTVDNFKGETLWDVIHAMDQATPHKGWFIINIVIVPVSCVVEPQK